MASRIPILNMLLELGTWYSKLACLTRLIADWRKGSVAGTVRFCRRVSWNAWCNQCWALAEFPSPSPQVDFPKHSFHPFPIRLPRSSSRSGPVFEPPSSFKRELSYKYVRIEGRISIVDKVGRWLAWEGLKRSVCFWDCAWSIHEMVRKRCFSVEVLLENEWGSSTAKDLVGSAHRVWSRCGKSAIGNSTQKLFVEGRRRICTWHGIYSESLRSVSYRGPRQYLWNQRVPFRNDFKHRGSWDRCFRCRSRWAPLRAMHFGRRRRNLAKLMLSIVYHGWHILEYFVFNLRALKRASLEPIFHWKLMPRQDIFTSGAWGWAWD